MELREQKQATDRALKEVDLFTGRVAKLNDDLKEQITRNGQLAVENSTRQTELSAKLADINAILSEARHLPRSPLPSPSIATPMTISSLPSPSITFHGHACDLTRG